MAARAASALVVFVELGCDQRQRVAGANRSHVGLAGIGERRDQQFSRAVTDPVIDLLLANCRQVEAGQRVIYGIANFRRGLDQRAVEIEHDQVKGVNHGGTCSVG